ncbi:hypothetical protein DPMN_167343 [Dreissena polymorpha]|uniref:Uncharacterized protein n=1 Tax=Dreissena polymorpha TaxID=45954 RepID=A0A9D4IUY8_DREPO|nr:hypothetical protein DPMN_167343 [Dreissena polymorpha]
MPAKGEDRPKCSNSEVSNDSLNDGSIKQQLESMEQSLTYFTIEMNLFKKGRTRKPYYQHPVLHPF